MRGLIEKRKRGFLRLFFFFYGALIGSVVAKTEMKKATRSGLFH